VTPELVIFAVMFSVVNRVGVGESFPREGQQGFSAHGSLEIE